MWLKEICVNVIKILFYPYIYCFVPPLIRLKWWTHNWHILYIKHFLFNFFISIPTKLNTQNFLYTWIKTINNFRKNYPLFWNIKPTIPMQTSYYYKNLHFHFSYVQNTLDILELYSLTYKMPILDLFQFISHKKGLLHFLTAPWILSWRHLNVEWVIMLNRDLSIYLQ